MKTIYKHKLNVQRETVLELRGQVLSVGVQGDDIMVWATHDDKAAPLTTRISVLGTGHELDGTEGRFIGTVFFGALVFHVFANVTGVWLGRGNTTPPGHAGHATEEIEQ